MDIFLIFILGAIIGSFLNVVIYRYPIMLDQEWTHDSLQQLNQPLPENQKPFNLCVPRSHCPQCKKQISWYHNIPILSFLLLRGKCAHCSQKISVQYFLVEILSGVLSVLVYKQFHFTLATAAILILTWGLLALSFIDFKHQFLPDAITYCLLWLGLLVSTQSIFISPTQAIFGALIGYLFLYVIAKLYILFRKTEGMGLGDCKMLAMIGAWVGAYSLLNVILLSTLVALIVCVILLLTKKMKKENPIAFGPFIAIAGWIIVLYGSQITLWITQWAQ